MSTISYKLDLMLGTSLDQKQLKKVESQLDTLYNKYKGKNIMLGGSDKKVIDGLSNSVGKLNTNVKSATKSTDQFGNRMKTAISSTIQWTLAVGGLYAAINKVKEAIDFTTQFDTSLTEIAMVTGQTRDAVAGLKDEYIELGEALKVSSLELANSAVALYRQGLSAQEVNERLAEISKAAKVAGLSVEQVTKAITSTTNAMGVSAEKTNDVLLKVASVAATDYQNISESLQKSASSFRSAGFEIEQSAAAIAVIQEVTQESASSIGTSLKTILARFNKVNEAGEDNSKVLNEIDRALQSVNISLTDSNGQLREVDDVLNELAPRWDGLTKNQQAYLTTQIAGARQANRFMVLMESYNRMLEIQAQAYDAAGTTQEQYLKFQESIQGQLNELQVAWEKFYDSLVDEDAIGDFLEFAISAVNLLTELNESVGLTNIAVATGVTKLAIYTASLTATTTATTALNFATSALLSTLTFGLSLIGTLAVTAWLEHKKTVEDVTNAYETLDETLDSALSTQNRVKVLSDLKSEMEDLYKTELNFIKFYEDENKTLDENSELYKENMGIIKDLKKEISDYYDVSERLSEAKLELKWEDYNNVIKETVGLSNELADETSDLTNSQFLLSEAIDKSFSAMSSLSDVYSSVNEGEKISIENLWELAKLYPDYGAQILSVNDSKEAGKKLTELLFEAEKKRAVAVLEQEKEIAKAKLEGLKLTIKQLGATDPTQLSKLSEIYADINSINTAIEKINELTISTYKVSTSSQKASSSIKELSMEIEDLSDVIDDANDAVDEFGEAIKDSLEDQIEYMEDQQDLIDDQIDALKEAKELREDQLKTEEKLKAIEEARKRLADAESQRNVRVLTARGWEWTADPSAVAQAQDDLKTAQEDYADWQEDLEYKKNLKILQDKKESYQKEINIVKDYLDDLSDIEAESFIDRLAQFQSFVSKWNAEASKMQFTSGVSVSASGAVSKSSEAQSSILAQMKANSEAWHGASDADKQKLSDANLAMGASLGLTRDEGGIWRDDSGVRQYRFGGDKVGDGLAYLHNGEGVLTADMNKAFKTLVSNITGVGMPNIPMSPVNKMPISSGGDTYNVNITAPNGATLNGMLIEARQLSRHGR